MQVSTLHPATASQAIAAGSPPLAGLVLGLGLALSQRLLSRR